MILTMVAQQHSTGRNVMLLSNLLNLLLLEQRRSSASQRTVCSNQDTLFLAVIHNFLLRQVRVVLNLVCGGGDFGFLHEFFQEGDGEVGDTDGLCLSGGEELFHLLPGLGVGPGCVEVAGAVGVFGEFGVVAFGVHGDRPMHEVTDDVRPVP